ncbi:cytochrome P450 [Martensiomyces pterosporus]|nr:cytochrome P450 [Martensiomyces pterosporus]
MASDNHLQPLWALLQPVNLCTGIIAYMAYKVIYALYFSPVRNIPGPFFARISKLPIILSAMRGTLVDDMINGYETYGSIFVMEPEKVSICDPSDCKLILGTHNFRKDKQYEQADFIEPNMFLTRDPELNKQRRRQVGPALGMSSLRKMEPAILEAGVQQLIGKWSQAIDSSEDGRAKVCYFYDFSLMTFDVISSLGFGKAHRSLTTGDRTIVNGVAKTFKLMILQMVLPAIKRFPLKQLLARSLYQSVEEFITFGNHSIEDRKHQLAQGGSKPNDILQSFIDAEDPESKIKMTSSQVTTEAIIILLAGADTSSNTLSWALHLLLLHPAQLKRVFDEVRGAFDKDHLITFDEAKEKLPYLEACVYEAMRICPVSGNLSRTVPPGGVVIQGHFLPENFSCSPSVPGVHMNRDLWESPHVFNPERFVDDEERKHNILTFSAGVRICPGRYLAWLEIMTALANFRGGGLFPFCKYHWVLVFRTAWLGTADLRGFSVFQPSSEGKHRLCGATNSAAPTTPFPCKKPLQAVL